MHRRLLAALAAMLSVFAICTIASGHASDTIQAYTAIQRIPGGTTLTESQLQKTAIPAALAPDGWIASAADLVGRMTAGPIPAGAIVTTDSLVAASQAADGFVIIPVSVSSQLLAVLSPGDHVSVFLSNLTTGEAQVVRGVRVVTIPQPGSSGIFSSGGSSQFILVEVPDDAAAMITTASSTGTTTVAIE